MAALAVSISALILVTPAAQAAPPSNDNFANAQVVGPGLPIVEGGTTVGATAEAGEPGHGGFGSAARSVWYVWTPSSSAETKIDICEDALAPRWIAVYTGTQVNALTPVANSGGACRMHFPAATGTTYRIAVDASGEYEFKLKLRQFTPPGNDDFANAQVVGPGLPISRAGTNVDATTETGEPDHSGFGGGPEGSVWYRWTPSASTEVKVDVCQGDPEDPQGFVVSVYIGTQVDSLTKIADGHFGFASSCSLHFAAASGTPYSIAIDSQGEGSFTLEIRHLNRPANDDFANAQTIGPGVPVNQPGTTVDATAESGEPDHADLGAAHNSVWYEWTPSASFAAKLQTCDADGGGPTIALYTGTQVNALNPVTTSSAGCHLYFPAVAGTTYEIAVDGFGEGPFTLNVHQLNRPANDNFANALGVGPAVPINQPGSNVDATAQSGEPTPFGSGPAPPAYASVWYEWTPSASGPAKVDVCDTSPDGSQPSFAIYSGTEINALARVAGTSDGWPGTCRVQFTAAAGTSYKIAVDSYSEGEFTLNIHVLTPPANDDFASAEVLSPPALPLTRSGTNVDATHETGEPNLGYPAPFKNSVWYSWTPGSSGETAVDVCDGGLGAVGVGVFTGSAVNALTLVTKGACRLHFSATAGTTFRIAVDGSDEGPFTLNLHPYSPPANDDFANALTVGPGLPVNQPGTTVDATRESYEPNPLGFFGPRATASVWYRWTPSGDADVTIGTCSGNLNTMLGVYTGSRLVDLGKLAANDDACGSPDGTASQLAFHAIGGTTYSIAVDAPYLTTGPFTLAIATPPPASSSGPAPPQQQPQQVPAPTGRRAAALKKCKKKHGVARKRCIRKARKLPV